MSVCGFRKTSFHPMRPILGHVSVLAIKSLRWTLLTDGSTRATNKCWVHRSCASVRSTGPPVTFAAHQVDHWACGDSGVPTSRDPTTEDCRTWQDAIERACSLSMTKVRRFMGFRSHILPHTGMMCHVAEALPVATPCNYTRQ